jgi:hypothetical protein
VLLIRIQKNPKGLAWSESKKKFWFGSRYWYKIKIPVIPKKQRLNTWKRTKRMASLFYSKTFCSVLQVPEYIGTQWELLYFPCQNISLRIRIRKWQNTFLNPNPMKIDSNSQHCFLSCKKRPLHHGFLYKKCCILGVGRHNCCVNI